MTTPNHNFIVMLSGRKRSGKDTFAERLVSEHGYTRVAFADPIKEMLLALDPIIDHDQMFDELVRVSDFVSVEGWEEAKAHPEVRRLLQRLGTEAGRDILGDRAWVDLAKERIAKIDGPVVVTDARFPNELAIARSLCRGGAEVRIERPSVESADTHPSETALDDHAFHLVVNNNGTVEQLHAVADRLAHALELGSAMARSSGALTLDAAA